MQITLEEAKLIIKVLEDGMPHKQSKKDEVVELLERIKDEVSFRE